MYGRITNEEREPRNVEEARLLKMMGDGYMPMITKERIALYTGLTTQEVDALEKADVTPEGDWDI